MSFIAVPALARRLISGRFLASLFGTVSFGFGCGPTDGGVSPPIVPPDGAESSSVATGGAPAQGGLSAGGAATGGRANEVLGGATGDGSSVVTGSTETGGGTAGSSSPDCNDVSDQPIIDVAKSGGDYTTVQAAVDSLPGDNAIPTTIRIAPGTYTEKLTVTRPNITLCGQKGAALSTILSYGDGGDTHGTTGSASTNISSDDVSVENLTFENSRGAGTQAVALLISSDRVQFRDCRFIGHQDTLYVKGGSQYFKDCHVEGTVDFIFGGASAVFDDCTIHSVGGGTALTAPSTDEARAYGIVFLGGEVTAESGLSSGSVALGRNWRPHGAAAFIETEMGDHISGVGWVKMGDNELSTARFSEYRSSGPGANPSERAPESRQLSDTEFAEYTVDNVLGSWNPSFAE